MKKFKAILSIVLALSFLLMAGCSTDQPQSSASATPSATQSSAPASSAPASPAAGGSFKIGIANREITNDFNRDIISSAQATIEAAGGTVVTTDAQADYQKHNENIENLLNSGIDGLIVQLGDPQQLAPIMAKAKAKGIPVVTAGVGSPVPDTITDVNGDDALMATLATDALLAKIGYKGDVYIVWVPGAPLLETRKRIFEAIAADYPKVVIHEVPAEHNPAKVQTQIEEIMTANPEPGSIAGIFGTYDQLVSGASEAVRRAGRGDEVSIVGIDGDRIAFQMLFQEDSPFVATIVQDVPSIGTKAAQILLDVLNGKIKAEDISPKTAANCYVASRKNGVAAAELRWTTSFWGDVSLTKADVEKAFPQTEEVLVTYPTSP